MEAFNFVAQLVTREYARRQRHKRQDLIDHHLDALPMPSIEQVGQWCESFARAADERDANALNALVAEVSAWRSPAEPWGRRPTGDLCTAGLSQELAGVLVDDIGLPRVEHVVDAVLHRQVMLLARGLTQVQIKDIRRAAERFRKIACGSWEINRLPETEYKPSKHPASAKQVRVWTRRFGCLARDNTHPRAIQRLVQEVLDWQPDMTAWEDRSIWELAACDGGTLDEHIVSRLSKHGGFATVLDALEYLVQCEDSETPREDSLWSSNQWKVAHADLERAVKKHRERVVKEHDGAAALTAPAARASGTGTYARPHYVVSSVRPHFQLAHEPTHL